MNCMHLHSHCVRIKACIDLQLQVLCEDCPRPNRFQSGDVVRFLRFSFEQTLLQVLEDKEKAIILEELPGAFPSPTRHRLRVGLGICLQGVKPSRQILPFARWFHLGLNFPRMVDERPSCDFGLLISSILY